MKTYLEFSVNGDIQEIKSKDKVFDVTNYDYKFIDNIEYNKYNFIILYNKYTEDQILNNYNNYKKNITKLPFLEKIIYGKFIIFLVDSSNNLKSFTENKLLNLINIKPSNIDDIDNYSSDDFNLSD